MLTAKILASVGLGFDIIGAILLFFFGSPPAIDSDGGEYLTDDATPEGIRKAKRNQCFGRIALGMICLGFVLQLLAVCCVPATQP